MFTDAQLASILQCPLARASRWRPHLERAMQRTGISTRRRAAHFLAQIGHESHGLARLEENLNYSAPRLLEVFENHFTRDTANAYARQPARIANRVYANRNGNGPEASGDGWMYRGRSPIQLTGRGNYAALQALTGHPLVDMPTLALEPDVGADIACAFWRSRGLNAMADAGDVVGITRRVNGGRNGLADRVARTRRACAVLEVR